MTRLHWPQGLHNWEVVTERTETIFTNIQVAQFYINTTIDDKTTLCVSKNPDPPEIFRRKLRQKFFKSKQISVFNKFAVLDMSSYYCCYGNHAAGSKPIN